MYKKILISSFLIFFSSIYPWCVSSTQAKEPHGIILISLDTLRADHLGVYDYHRNTSPFIDAFAKESIVFENAVSQSSWTLPSHMSIMTSLYPSFHGHINKDTTSSLALANKYVTLAELLHKGGYQTAAFTDGGFMRAVFGFDQGFDVYNDRGGGIARILPRVKNWLDKSKKKKFFLFIHSFDIHSPYNPPPPYKTMFHDFSYNGSLIPSNTTLTAILNNKLQVNDEDLRHIISFYDGGIRYTDKKIGEFLSYLQQVGLKDQSLIIITSDHGEEFNEHGSILHWQLYQKPDLHVPLIAHVPNYPKKEVRINKLVRSIDLMPTILDIAGLPPHSKAQGRSLHPLIKRYKNPLNNLPFGTFSYLKRKPVISFAETKYRKHKKLDNSFWSVITDDGYQMISNMTSDSFKLFNLEDDPLAKNDISKDHDDIIERLLFQREKLYSTKPKFTSSAITLDKQTHEQLKALGYIAFPTDEPKEVVDADGDGILDDRDNCTNKLNPTQIDTDKDGVGDACDMFPKDKKKHLSDRDDDCIPDIWDDCIDTDWDGYGNPGFPDNTCKKDNCPNIFNLTQEDRDKDGLGDVCDPD